MQRAAHQILLVLRPSGPFHLHSVRSCGRKAYVQVSRTSEHSAYDSRCKYTVMHSLQRELSLRPEIDLTRLIINHLPIDTGSTHRSLWAGMERMWWSLAHRSSTI